MMLFFSWGELFPVIDDLIWKYQVARHPDAVSVVTGIVGCAGLKVDNDNFLSNFM